MAVCATMFQAIRSRCEARRSEGAASDPHVGLRARGVFLAWVSVPLWETLLRLGDIIHPTPLQWTLEWAAWVVAGLAHARVGADDWRGSGAWPAVVLLLLGGAAAAGVALPSWAVLPAIAAGYGVVRVLHEPLLRRVPGSLLTALAALSLHFACVGPPPLDELASALFTPRAATASGPSMVVITIDTLRADAARDMRSIQTLAERGSVFPRAMAASSWTVPSLATVWTGEPSAIHGAGRSDEGRFTGVRPSVATLAEELSAQGYRTGAIVTNAFIGEGHAGLRRGFDTWTYVDGSRTYPLAVAGWPPGGRQHGDARDVVDAALEWLDDAPAEGFLLWVHLLDPHLPYAHSRNPERYTPELMRAFRSGHLWYVSAADIRRAYDNEVAYVDREVSRLLARLDARGHFERGAVVLTSDHGEELLEHGGLEHGHSHHGEVTDVPLAIAAPGMPRGVREELASHQDIAPTLRALVGLAPRGRDLREPIPASRVATADGNLYYHAERSLRFEAFRVIERRRTEVTVFDLAADPHERRPITPTPEEVRRYRSRWNGRDDLEPAPPMDVIHPGLRALGYIP